MDMISGLYNLANELYQAGCMSNQETGGQVDGEAAALARECIREATAQANIMANIVSYDNPEESSPLLFAGNSK